MSYRAYVPQRGDIMHINASPSAGKEMAGRHFALCLSPELYCKRSGLAIVLFATSKLKPEQHPRFGFVLELPPNSIREGADKGVLLCDCVHQIDFREREAAFVSRTETSFVEHALDILLSAMDEA